MNSENVPPYDVFISHSPVDQEWVATWLAPRLEAAGLRVAVRYRDFVAGQPEILNVEELIAGSRRTVAVITPEWLASEWNAFEDVLVRSLDPAARRRRLIPILLRPVELPPALAALECIDLTAERQWESELKRLTRDLGDVPPVKVPWHQPKKIALRRRWARWLRRYRRQVRLAVGLALVFWVLASTLLHIWPFHDRTAWLADGLAVPHARVLHNTGSALFVGADNREFGCQPAHKGLWWRPLDNPQGWQESDVGDFLCVDIAAGEALSDIRAIASRPGDPNTIYALASDSALLVSEDGGRTFRPHAAGQPPVRSGDRPLLLDMDDSAEPSLWVSGQKLGLYRYRDGAWARMDEGGTAGCQGLAGDISVASLLIRGSRVLIGTREQGLWLSEDGGETCRLVFDPGGRYSFLKLAEAPEQQPPRYLALVRDGQTETDFYQLLDICPRADSCTASRWRAAQSPLWRQRSLVNDLFVQRDAAGAVEWWLVTGLGGVRRGHLVQGDSEPLPRITRCILPCEVTLAPAGDGRPPYLLASGTILPGSGHVYTLTTTAWWRRLWP